jgi:hypothetical protein
MCNNLPAEGGCLKNGFKMARNEELRKQSEARLANETALASSKASGASSDNVKSENVVLTLLLSQQKEVSDLVNFDEK